MITRQVKAIRDQIERLQKDKARVTASAQKKIEALNASMTATCAAIDTALKSLNEAVVALNTGSELAQDQPHTDRQTNVPGVQSGEDESAPGSLSSDVSPPVESGGVVMTDAAPPAQGMSQDDADVAAMTGTWPQAMERFCLAYAESGGQLKESDVMAGINKYTRLNGWFGKEAKFTLPKRLELLEWIREGKFDFVTGTH